MLNAKYHEKRRRLSSWPVSGMVTIATNMAGRGTDIVLGEGVVELGGLHVIGMSAMRSGASITSCGPFGPPGDPVHLSSTCPWKMI